MDNALRTARYEDAHADTDSPGEHVADQWGVCLVCSSTALCFRSV